MKVKLQVKKQSKKCLNNAIGNVNSIKPISPDLNIGNNARKTYKIKTINSNQNIGNNVHKTYKIKSVNKSGIASNSNKCTSKIDKTYIDERIKPNFVRKIVSLRDITSNFKI